MPNSVLWVCLVAIWLFVLVPMVIKGRPEVRKRTEATLATRVINRGGRAMSKASSKIARGRHPHDAEWVAPVREYRKPGELINEMDDHSDVLVDDEPDVDVDLDEVIATADADVEASDATEHDDDATDEGDTDDAEVAESDDADLGDADLDDEYDADDSYEDDADESDDYEVVSEPLTAQEPTRRGRGGYDPNADTRRSETRYRSRQRILLVVAVLAIASVGVGVVLGGIGWVATGAGVVLLVGYMAYLRRTVRIEERIRRQRSVRAARAARMTQQRRRIFDEGPLADEIPEHLIRPGAVVLEIDDEHPVFDHLPPFQRRRVMREEPEFRRAVGE